MPASAKFSLVPVAQITVEDRRRVQKGDIEELALSIARFGLIHPITINRKGRLIAGERRLLAFKHLKRVEIPAQLFEELNAHEARAVEMEENARRLDFHWTEQATAILQYHEFHKLENPDWGIEQTADALGMSEMTASKAIRVAREYEATPGKFEAFDSINAAYNSLSRESTRAIDAEMTAFLQAEDAEEYLNGVTDDLPSTPQAQPGEFRKYRSPILDTFQVPFEQYLADEWLIRKQLFNVVHCDFPYGVGLHTSDQANVARRGEESYEDTPEIFWNLTETLCRAAPTILAPKAHLLFWYPTADYTRVVEALTSAGFEINPVPLIWVKSDNTGILPDANRGPRRVYETALLMAWGDRFIIKAVSNAFSHPANRANAQHPSEKPIPVVKHFLSMLVDQYTNVLDPTCGSGTALVAGEELGAATVTGVEQSKIHIETTRNALTKSRVSRL